MRVLGRIWNQAIRSLAATVPARAKGAGFAELARQAEERADANAAAALFARLDTSDVAQAQACWRIGRTLGRAGRLGEAHRALEVARELDPSSIDVISDLGNVAALSGRLDDAERHYRAALERAPGNPGVLANLGHLLRVRRDSAGATAAFSEALAHDPACEAALKGYAGLASTAGGLERLAGVLERVPECAAAHCAHAAVLLRVTRQAARALEQFDVARRLGLDDADLHGGRGLALVALGRTEEALCEFDVALAHDPGNEAWRWHRALALLALGRFAEGWIDYEIRLRSEDRPQRDFTLPRWDGGDLSTKTIVVHAEQGLGDEIMFASCLPEVIARARGCVVDCDPKLGELYRRSFPGARIHSGTQFDDDAWLATLGPADCQIPVGSLPLHLRRTREEFPDLERYLVADPIRVRRWRERLDASGARTTIGLSWQGGTRDTGRERRSVGLEQLRPLLDRPDTLWVSLQYDARAEDVQGFARASGLRFVHWPEAISNYEETAALLCALALTVSVCTALVHLAGALGRPAWVLTPLAPEWHYGTSGKRMAWYRSVRLFRQRPGESWEPAIARLGAALDARLASLPDTRQSTQSSAQVAGASRAGPH